MSYGIKQTKKKLELLCQNFWKETDVFFNNHFGTICKCCDKELNDE